jgi:outer membrane receptor protein involved in Fe transport
MRVKAALLAGICASVVAVPAAAQDASTQDTSTQSSATPNRGGGVDGNVIVVTAQRQAQSLQDVPIAVSAFSSEALEKQQIKNASDLQLTLPNVTFSKGNFTGSSFTIRGVGDLCVGISCDAATAIHLNGTPLLATRIFETEYFDLERIEVLRGPQGTLFGRNATSGVLNFITAKPDLSGFHASAEAEYGNYDSIKLKGMVNLPLTDTLGVRVAGFYLNRDGYTHNLYNDTRIDGRDMYSVRASLRWEPGPDTTVDLMGSYFHERDDRLRIQKQLCQRDPTGVLGCLARTRGNDRTNSNSTLGATLPSREFLPLVFNNAALTPIAQALALTSIYGPDTYLGSPNSADPREVYTAYNPTYFTDELQLQGRFEHQFGNIKAQLTGFYHETQVDSSQDYNLGVQNRANVQPTLNNLAFFAANGFPGLPGSAAYFAPLAAALIPNGPTGQICTSLGNNDNLGVFGGHSACADVPLALDRSTQKTRDYSGEMIISSDFSGPFNFLLGGIYVDGKVTNGDYFVDAFGLDYTAGVLGFVQSYFAGLPPAYSGPSQFRNATAEFRLKSYGIFGEVYYDFSDALKLTLGIRYNNDKKSVLSRSSLFNFLVPYSETGNAFDAPGAAKFDADPLTAGAQPFLQQNGKFDKFTGRAVLDYKITPDNLLYASYSRGYKSGGFNPPPQVAGLTYPPTFAPELIDAFEVGSKNTFANGALTLNLTGFYYKYNGLQLSRIVARTSINDNVNANIYGVEAEAIVRPDPTWTFNLGFSYLHTKVTSDTPFINQRDPSGGNPNTVIIKDPQAFNCVVVGPSAAAAQAFVAGANQILNASVGLTSANGLRGPQAFPSDSGLGAATGAFSSCAALRNFAATNAFGLNPGGLISVPDGVAVSIKGNELPQAPVVKFSMGVQKRIEMNNAWTLTPRLDVVYTGESYGNIFNGPINRIEGYEQVNAQIQLDGPDDRWFVRGFVQNLFDSNAITGLYLTDQSSGLFTNIFTLEPRRYGIAAGVKF